jgi:glycosyltransferase involved in cell wall biosynthesis
LYLFIPIIRLIKSKPIFIADEYPVPIRVYLKESIPKWKIILFRYILNQVEGMIFMTNNLMTFYNDIVKKPSFILPSITDLSRFSNLSSIRISDSVRYICYMGNMELSKDNVDNIIEAFSLIANKHSNLELHLYGAPSSHDLQKIIEIISKLNLTDRVIFKGKVANSEVPRILSESFILVSSQPITKRSEGGFPTKLGEYMASGVPSLVTNVGEIDTYVTDSVNVWLAKPCDPEDYAQKIEYIINNYTEALEVAESAKKYVLENFDYKSQSKNLKGFLLKLISEDEVS